MKDTHICKLAIAYSPVAALSANSRNARTHSKRQIRQIAASIRTFGFNNPIIIDKNAKIVAGHGRWEAAKLAGMDSVPTILLENLTEDQIRAYILADNRLAELAGWDNSILAIELQHLINLDDLDVTVTGFDVPEVDMILEEAGPESDKDDVFDVDETATAVSEAGDLWQLGEHRVLCGSALQVESFGFLMAGQRADVVFVDPPYNVVIDGHAGGHGSIHHREFAMASGEMDQEEFIAFLTSSLRLLAKFSTRGSVHFVCMDWRHAEELLAAGKQIYDSLLNLCVWVKNNGGMGSFYRSRHELVFVYRNGKAPHRNNVQLGQYGRNRTNVWEYPGINTLSQQGDEGNLLALHPTVKPVALVADALLDCSARGQIVLDSFLGSGSTLIAAERVGRICYGIEIDPLYVDTAVRRWQRHTGENAVHMRSGKTFNDASSALEVNHD
ncbi:MAG TPA: DNA methyltransferase [Terriglobales bacterium]|nr:DNA methyltransferase [Terriglobales bacterium]